MTIYPPKPVLIRPVEHVSDGTDLTGDTAVTVASGLYPNVIALMQACCTTSSGITDLRLSDDFKFELYSEWGVTVDFDNTTLGDVLGFGSQVVLAAATWVTAAYRPRYIWIPEYNVADQDAFELDTRSLIAGDVSANGTLAANQIGSKIYYRNTRFIAEDNYNVARQFCTTDEDEYRTLEEFVLGACTVRPQSATVGNPRGFWWYPDINDAISQCTYQPSTDYWSSAGDIDFDKSSSPSTHVFCHFDDRLMMGARTPFFEKSTLKYNVNLSFHTVADLQSSIVSTTYESSAYLLTDKNGQITVTTVSPVGTSFYIHFGDGSAAQEVVGTGASVNTNHTYTTGDEKIITFYDGIDDIEYLDMSSIGANLYGSISSLSAMTSMEELRLYNTGVTGDISALSTMTSMEKLRLYNTSVTGNLSSLSAMTGFTYIHLGNTSIAGNLSSLSALTSMVYLYLYNTSVIGDIDNLDGMTGLTNLYLYSTSVSGGISDLSPATGIALMYLYDTSVDPGSDSYAAWSSSDIRAYSCGWTSTNVDNFLIYLDNAGGSNGSANIAGTNAARTSASDAAVTSLLGKSWTLTVN